MLSILIIIDMEIPLNIPCKYLSQITLFNCLLHNDATDLKFVDCVLTATD